MHGMRWVSGLAMDSEADLEGLQHLGTPTWNTLTAKWFRSANKFWQHLNLTVGNNEKLCTHTALLIFDHCKTLAYRVFDLFCQL